MSDEHKRKRFAKADEGERMLDFEKRSRVAEEAVDMLLKMHADNIVASWIVGSDLEDLVERIKAAYPEKAT